MDFWSELDIGNGPYVGYKGYFYNLSLLRTPANVSDTEECLNSAVMGPMWLLERWEEEEFEIIHRRFYVKNITGHSDRYSKRVFERGAVC